MAASMGGLVPEWFVLDIPDAGKPHTSLRWRDPEGGRAVVMARSARRDLASLGRQIHSGIDSLHRLDISVGSVVAHWGSSGLEPLDTRLDLQFLAHTLSADGCSVVWWRSADR